MTNKQHEMLTQMGKKPALEASTVYQVGVTINIELLQEEGWEQLKENRLGFRIFNIKKNNMYLKYLNYQIRINPFSFTFFFFFWNEDKMLLTSVLIQPTKILTLAGF